MFLNFPAKTIRFTKTGSGQGWKKLETLSEGCCVFSFFRSVDFRWTEWFVYDKEKGAPMWDKDPAAAELYDHRGDLGDGRAFDDFENENLANSTEAGLAAARAELRAVLRAQFQHDDGR